MSNIEYLTAEIERLSDVEKQEIAKKLLEKMSNDEIIQLLEKLKDNMELIEMLKIAEPLYKDWDNEEDSIYDNL
ncbi:MAG: hypothetical protein ACOX1J_02625 [Dethiobacteria bacterium]|jgi:hypothetical protein